MLGNNAADGSLTGRVVGRIRKELRWSTLPMTMIIDKGLGPRA